MPSIQDQSWLHNSSRLSILIFNLELIYEYVIYFRFLRKFSVGITNHSPKITQSARHIGLTIYESQPDLNCCHISRYFLLKSPVTQNPFNLLPYERWPPVISLVPPFFRFALSWLNMLIKSRNA